MHPFFRTLKRIFFEPIISEKPADTYNPPRKQISPNENDSELRIQLFRESEGPPEFRLQPVGPTLFRRLQVGLEEKPGSDPEYHALCYWGTWCQYREYLETRLPELRAWLHEKLKACEGSLEPNDFAIAEIATSLAWCGDQQGKVRINELLAEPGAARSAILYHLDQAYGWKCEDAPFDPEIFAAALLESNGEERRQAWNIIRKFQIDSLWPLARAEMHNAAPRELIDICEVLGRATEEAVDLEILTDAFRLAKDESERSSVLRALEGYHHGSKAEAKKLEEELILQLPDGEIDFSILCGWAEVATERSLNRLRSLKGKFLSRDAILADDRGYGDSRIFLETLAQIEASDHVMDLWEESPKRVASGRVLRLIASKVPPEQVGRMVKSICQRVVDKNLLLDEQTVGALLDLGKLGREEVRQLRESTAPGTSWKEKGISLETLLEELQSAGVVPQFASPDLIHVLHERYGGKSYEYEDFERVPEFFEELGIGYLFDNEFDSRPVDYVSLIRHWTKITQGALSLDSIEQWVLMPKWTDGSADSQYHVELQANGWTCIIKPEDHSDHFDVETLLTGMNKLVKEIGREERFIQLQRDQSSLIVWANPETFEPIAEKYR